MELTSLNSLGINYLINIQNPLFLLVRQSPCDNCYSPFSPTTFFEIQCRCVSTDFWVLSCFWYKRDYNAVPFECRFISQSLCKCDCSLSQESIRKTSHFSFSFCKQSQAYFVLFLELRDKRKVSQRNLYWSLEIRVLRNLYPNSRIVTLRKHDTVNSTVNLSTWRHLTNQAMIPESGIMEWWHQRHVSRLLHSFPLHGPPQGSLNARQNFSWHHFFTFFPHCGAWSQATVSLPSSELTPYEFSPYLLSPPWNVYNS